MKAETVYQKLKEKANKNMTNGSVGLDRGRAVFLFNEEQNKFIEWTLQKRNNTNTQDIQMLLDTVPLKQKSSGSNFTTFSLPDNFFSHVTVEVKATKGSCGPVSMQCIPIKPENDNELLFDENSKPSFEYREVPYTIEDNSIKIYKDDFTIQSVKLKYYRYPIQFDLQGYITEDNTPSTDSDPEFDDKIVDRIISMCVTSFDINNENLNKIQMDINRVNSKF